MARHPFCLLLTGLLCLFCGPLRAADWPQWRYDARRGAVSPQVLADKLHVQWTRSLPPLKVAWPDQAKMQFDDVYEPIVTGKLLIFGSSRNDSLTALDTETGQEKWRFFAEGPIRFAPAAWEGRVYFTADDGYLYCLDQAKGTLLWRFRGGPDDRKILGNERLISIWPARGAPVIADGTVYFAASIWPFMGIFIHALDAKTGQVNWTNDGDGSVYIKQPHNADSFAGVAPQGPLVVSGDRLLIPGGRSVPACLDRKTGKLLRYQLAENGKRGGGYEVAALDKVFFNGGAAFDLDTQKYLAEVGQPVVLVGDTVYAYSAGALRGYDAGSATLEEVETIDRKGKVAKVTRWRTNERGSCRLPPVECLIMAGGQIYAGGKDFVAAVTVDGNTLREIWRDEIEGTAATLVAGDDRLFVVTREGAIHCLGAKATPVISEGKLPQASSTALDIWNAKARDFLNATNQRAGYCLVWGVNQGRLVSELARQSRLHIIGVDGNANRILDLRDQLAKTDLYGHRVALLAMEAKVGRLPSYLANLMIVEQGYLDNQPEALAVMYQSLRPFGGAMCLLHGGDGASLKNKIIAVRLPQAEIEERPGFLIVKRQGPLPGSANWSHEHADAANTRVSKDQLVKAPLGLLWFGGPPHDDILPRHGHGPQPQVVDGRLIIEGVDLIRAMDIYTGRLLWETKLPGVGAFYNSVLHQPGANASGSNYVCTSDGIHVVYGKSCLKLDPVTGKQVAEFLLPALPDMSELPLWGYVNVAGDYLIGGADPLLDPKLLPMIDPKESGDDPDPPPKDAGIIGRISKLLKTAKGFNDNLSSSKHLVVMDRHTGKVLWTAAAQAGFRHNATCAGGGKLFTIDRLSGQQVAHYKRRGEEPPSASKIRVFDLKNGKELWSTDVNVFGTWLSYSAKHDVVIESGRVARDTMLDEPKGMRAYNAQDGTVLWYEKTYVGPAMIHGDTVLQDQGACDLLSGALKMRQDPITGQIVPWRWQRHYGCNTPAASEHLLTFRSGAAGYFDYCNDGGTGNLGGFRSSCTNNLIVAGGVLVAPEYTRTCTCAYQNQTSIGLIHMPEAEMWTFFGTKEVRGPVQRLGINFGAPGDRKASDGTLWLEYPSVAGVSPLVNVATQPEKLDLFRRHSSKVEGKWNWIASSGARGVNEVKVKLGGGRRKYTVRLYFTEPDNCQPGQRRFHVELQGHEVLRDLDIAKETGAAYRSLMREFTGIEANADLTLRLIPDVGVPVLCGLEIIAEERR